MIGNDEPGQARATIESLEREFRRYKKYAEATFEQLTDADLSRTAGADGNSVAVIAWHISGNLKSRFADFLTTDGEKPWRDRESEFDERDVSLAAMREQWEQGWQVLFSTLSTLSDADLEKTVSIRAESMAARDALLRALGHISSHVGQIVLLGKSMRGTGWRTLTIPRKIPNP